MQCPLCGKYSSIEQYDPSNFNNDILIIKYRGLGRGNGFEISDKYSLFDGSDPELLDLISERVAVLYDMLYEDVEDDDKAEEEDSADIDDDDDASLSELEKELRRGEEEDDDEGEDITGFEEMIDYHEDFTQETAEAPATTGAA